MSERLENALARLREEAAQAEPPAAVEAALLAEFERAQQRRKLVAWTWRSTAVAAAVVLLLFAQVGRQPDAPPVAGQAVEPEQPFVPIPYTAPLSPYEQPSIVRMDLPVAALIAAGLPMETRDPAARVEADVVVGQDGMPRAVRVVSVSKFE